jgi:VIT1/CCC1 family predicted Fe2+/Mn2+ transporter
VIFLAYENLDKESFSLIKSFQQDEINSYEIYKRLSKRMKDDHNSKILERIAEDELKHYNTFTSITKKNIKKQRLKISFYYYITVIFGLTFGIRLMERSEKDAQAQYANLGQKFPILLEMIKDEERHEDELITMLNDDMLTYVSSIVLGLNDALVELTGALAGFTFSLSNSKTIALAGIIVGVSAAFSMAASEYLSESEDNSENKSALKSSIYTGISYIVVVFILTTPYIIFPGQEVVLTLGIVLVSAILIIFLFTYYTSVAKNTKFKKRFIEMVSISMGVALFSLVLGFVAKSFLHIEVA